MLNPSPFSGRATAALTLAIVAVLAACGGDDSQPASGSGDAPSSQATSAPAPSATATTPAEPDDSGLVVKEVILDSGEFGGKLTVVLLNSGDEQCSGPTIIFDLLREDRSVVGRMGIIGERLDVGAEGSFDDRYIGLGVVETAVTLITCEHAASQEFLRDTPVPAEE